MRPDLHATRLVLQSGASTASAEMERSIDLAQADESEGVYLRSFFDEARRAAAAADPALPLAGLAFSAKDLFDLAGQPTPAGSAVLAHAPAAEVTAPSVARLLAAGGVLVGRTHMTEFAFSGVGVNPHHPSPRNAADDAVARIPGGSSSGAGISVARGSAFIGLGSDTGGSIRIPAALNGIVGFKNTARLVPTSGALPLSTTLDTVCAMTRSVSDAILAHEILSGTRVVPFAKPLAALRLAVPEQTFFDSIEPPVARAFESALTRLRAAGARVESIALPLLGELATLNATGGFSAAEAYAWHRLLLERSGAGYDPRVAQRILKGAGMKAHEYIDLQHGRRAWIARMEDALAPFDAVLSPTVPIVAPPIAEVAPGAERDEAFFRVNALLLRNPAVVNMLDGCAISLPCHAPGDLPVGLMIWHGALRDDAILGIARLAEPLLKSAP